MTPSVPRSRSRKVNGYVKAVLALEAVRRKRDERYDRFIQPLDRKRDQLAAEVVTRLRALSGGQQAEARRVLTAFASPVGSEPARDDVRRNRINVAGHNAGTKGGNDGRADCPDGEAFDGRRGPSLSPVPLRRAAARTRDR
jgi:hypothetical protein